MFIWNYNSIWLNLASILVMYIILSFVIGLIWIVLMELGYRRQNWLERRANKKYFKSIEELQNDFI